MIVDVEITIIVVVSVVIGAEEEETTTITVELISVVESSDVIVEWCSNGGVLADERDVGSNDVDTVEEC